MKKSILAILLWACALATAHADLTQDEDGFYLIGTASDLVEFSALSNNGEGGRNINARLTADIDMEGINFTPIGMHYDEDSPSGIPGDYRGTFDGQGHVIRNLYVERTDKCEAGLIGRTTDAVIKNLGIENATIRQQTPFSNGTNIRAGILAAIVLRGRIENCYTAGELNITNGTGAKGFFVATFLQNFGGSGSPMASCFTTGEQLCGELDGALDNCFAAGDIQTIGTTGELCYRLNSNQSHTVWYQTLGSDPYPVLDKSHKQVYPIGTLNCDGTPIPGTDLTYSNEPSPDIPPHQLDDTGICVNCGYDSNAFEPSADGWYEVDTPAKLRYMAKVVNEISQTAKIRLMADLDLKDIRGMKPIGYFDDYGTQTPFSGTFDGQGHTLYNLTVTVDDGQEVGLFGRISGGRLRNLGVVNATMTSSSTIRTGVLGGEIFSSQVENCFVIGDIVLNNGEGQKGGIAGEAVSSTFTGCFTTYDIAAPAASLVHSFAGEEARAMAPTGELCYRLNGEAFTDAHWFQNIGDDPYPTLDATHALVYKLGEGNYASALTADDFAALADIIINEKTGQWNNAAVTHSLLEAYMQQLEALRSCGDKETFLAAYAALSAPEAALQQSLEAYDAYDAKVNEVKASLAANPNIDGPDLQTLKDYLEGYEEPSEQFPHGSYAFITEYYELTAEEVTAEAAFVQTLLDLAIRSGYQAGADISKMLENPDFTDSTNGWTLSTGSATISNANNSQQGFKKVVVASQDIDINQTIEGLKDGVYEIEIPGITILRKIDDVQPIGLYNYGGFVYANENANYVETKFSDLLTEEEVNTKSLVYNKTRFSLYYTNEGDELGYAPNHALGVAFGRDAGHYRNRILANVTDGRLTVGVRNDKSLSQPNLTYLLRATLTYRGLIDSDAASEAMSEILADMRAKATHLIQDYEADFSEYADAPNYYNGLNTELENAIADIATAQTGEEKYALIGRFSDIFQRILACKQTYEKLMMTINDVLDIYGSFATTEQLIAIQSTADNTVEVFEQGNATQTEVEALIDELRQDEIYSRFKEPEMADGYYLISTPWNLAWFSHRVNSGQTGLNARLTTDLDMSEIENFAPIGLHIDPENGTHTENDYHGIFDGHGHVIRNLTVTTSQGEESGLFGRVQGSILRLGIENATITSTTGIRSGVLAGLILNTTGIKNCYTAGNLVVNTSHAENAPFANITAFGKDAGISNCYTTGESFGTQSPLSGSVTLPNSYCGVDVETMGPTGELCYRLNNNSSESPVWFQTLGQDTYPVLQDTHQVVYFADGVYYNEGGDAIESVTAATKEHPTVYDLSGRQITNRNLPKGIYIVGGKKMLIK